MEKNKIIKKSIEFIIYIAVFFLIVWGTPAVLSAALDTDYPIASITSSSMWPVLKEGDIVFIKGTESPGGIAAGDIVVYENNKGFTIHRVTRLNGDTVITKGDANTAEDKPVSRGSIIGKAVELRGKPIRIPYLGKLSMLKK